MLVYIKDSSFSLEEQLIQGIQVPINLPSPTISVPGSCRTLIITV